MTAIEQVTCRVEADRLNEFFDAWRDAAAVLLDQHGCEAVELRRGVEDPTELVVLITWESVEHHTRFTQTEGFGPVRDELRKFTVESMRHFKPVDLNVPTAP